MALAGRLEWSEAMFIRSERLFLRPGWPEEWSELLALIDDEEVVRNLARVPWPYTAEDARAFAAREHERMLPNFFITLPSAAGARLIGHVGLARDGREVELGYWIGRPYWGQGYATEAARALLSLARVLGHERLVASHFVDNPASGRVLRKLGFCPTGVVRNRFSLGRGGEAPAQQLALVLGDPSDCDDDIAAMRAA
jgi:RimJ/RimL family protein N-acetyltransferase